MKNLLIILLVLAINSCNINRKNTNQYIYWVDNEMSDCTGVAFKQCLRVQKSEEIRQGGWELFYSEIKGFNYQSGTRYKILVEEVHVDESSLPADASSIEYKLVKVLDEISDGNAEVGGSWSLESIEGKPLPSNTFRKLPSLNINMDSDQFFGNDGCNNYSGGIKEISAKSIVFGQSASTEMACGDMSISDAFNKAFSKVKYYRIKKNELILLGEKNRELLRFRRPS